MHSLRRSMVRNLCQANINRKVGMAITGHKTPRIYQNYNPLIFADLQRAAEKLEEQNRFKTATVRGFRVVKGQGE